MELTYILETMSAEVKGFLYTALVDMEMAVSCTLNI